MSDTGMAGEAGVPANTPEAPPTQPDFTHNYHPGLMFGGPDPDITVKPQPEERTPDIASVAIAAFRQNNEIASIFSNELNSVDQNYIEPGFDPLAAAKAAGHGNDDRYSHMFNQRAADALTAKIAREQSDQRIVAASGLFGIAMSGVAGIASPTSLIPGGAVADEAKVGGGLVKGAVRGGLATGAAIGVQEAGLQASQATRTPETSLFSIGGGLILGAMGGALASRLAPEERAALARKIDAELNAPEAAGEFADPTIPIREAYDAERARIDAGGEARTASPEPVAVEGGPVGAPRAAASVGADVVGPGEDLTIAGRAARQTAENTARLNPLLRMGTHTFQSVRDFADRIMENPLYLNRHFGLNATRTAESVEELTHGWGGKLAGATEANHALWKSYVKEGGRLTRPQFFEEVGKAMQEGDKHAVPQVANAAANYRKSLVEPLTKAAQETGQLPEQLNLTTAQSYFSRVPDRQKIIADEPAFRKVVRDHLKSDLQAQITRMTRARDGRLAALNAQIADLKLPAAERAALLKSLPEQLKSLKAKNGDFDALDEGLSDMRKSAADAAESGDARSAAEINQNIKKTTEVAGKDYADYVGQRNAIENRLATLRNNVAGRAEQVEHLRGKLVDAEAANIGRLQRLHKSLSKLDDSVAQADPSAFAARISAARTTFAKIMDRSNKAHDHLAKRLAKLRQEAQTVEHAPGEARTAPIPDDLHTILDNARTPLPRDPRKTMRDRPVRDMLRAMGGVDPEGPLAAELKHAGVTPQNSRGLFAKGGIQSGDNLVGSEHELFRDRPDTVESDLAGKGYIKPDALVEALKAEADGNPLRTAHEQQQIEDFQRHGDARDYYRQSLEDMGIDVTKMSDQQIMDRLGDVAFQRKVLDQMDAPPPAEGEHAYGAENPAPVTARDAALNSKQERALELFEAAERQRNVELTNLANRIGELERTDPQAALDLLRTTIDRRLTEAAGTIEREGVRMDKLSRRMDAADPKHAENLVKDLQAKAQGIGTEFDRKMEGLDAENDYKSYLDDAEENVVNAYAGRSKDQGSIPLPHQVTVATKGPLNERVFGIEDAKLRPWMDLNAERVMHRFTRVMAAEVELAKRFGESPTLKLAIAKIAEEAKAKLAEIDAKLEPGQVAGAHAEADARYDALRDQATKDNTIGTAETVAPESDADFKKWFDGSKAVDSEGKPLVVFHGTDADFDQFSKEHLGTATGAPSAKEGFFFASRKDVAESYAGSNIYEDSGFLRFLNKISGGLYQKGNEALVKLVGLSGIKKGRVVSARLSLKNPLVVDFGGAEYRDESFKSIIDRAKSAGHDGVIFKNTYDEGFYGGKALTDVYTVFEPDQIRVAKDKGVAPAPPEQRRSQALDNIEATRAAEHASIDATPTMTPEEKAQARLDLEKQKNVGTTYASAVRDIIRGTYKVDQNNGTIAHILTAANLVNYMGSLGGVVASSLNDAARPMMVHGLRAYMEDGLLPLISNLKAIKAMREDGLLGGALSERVNMGFVGSYADVLDDSGSAALRPTWLRFMDNMARVFSKYGNFIVPYTDYVKTMNYAMAQARILRNVRNWGEMAAREKPYMLLHHIDEDIAARITKQLDKHSIEIGGVEVANSKEWDDDIARRAFDSALLKDTRSNVVTPGVGDKPLAMHTPWGRALGQFQGYTFGAHSKILLRSMQSVEKDLDAGRVGFLLGATASVSAGMFTYWLKSLESGTPVSDNPGTWIAEGLDRSGLMSIFFLANNTIEKMSGYGGYGALATLFPGHGQALPASRYTNRSALGVLAGPTGQLLDTVQNLAVHASKGQITKTDVRAFKRLIPANGIPEINYSLNHFAVPAASEAIGATGN